MGWGKAVEREEEEDLGKKQTNKKVSSVFRHSVRRSQKEDPVI